MLALADRATRWLVTAVVAGVVMAAAGCGGEAPASDAAKSQPTTATFDSATATVAPVAASPTLPVATATPVEEACAAGARCAFIDTLEVAGDSLVVAWTASGFEPSFEQGFFHAHFFWDIYSAEQVGTNASTFGVARGDWELTAKQPFVSATEMLVSNRPAPANKICVTVANSAHAVADPLVFDCLPISEDLKAG
jgi:hypothetical protein